MPDKVKMKTEAVLDSFMAYRETGTGHPIVFLHGNPTSSYLWRNVIPHIEHFGRCLAPDLIGMGRSGKLTNTGPGSYRFVDHRKYLDALLVQLGVEDNVILIVHDWGSALGFDWARRHPKAVRGIAYMEAITAVDEMAKASPQTQNFYRFFHTPEGEQAVLEENYFIEKMLLGSLGDRLSDADRKVYRTAWLEAGESRRPMLTWPLEIPVDGEPKDMAKIVRDYQAWMETNDVPKLFIRGEPSPMMVGTRLEAARRWSNQTEVAVKCDPDAPPAANHYIQEVCPNDIGAALALWIEALT